MGLIIPGVAIQSFYEYWHPKRWVGSPLNLRSALVNALGSGRLLKPQIGGRGQNSRPYADFSGLI
jgi:hypothetical protein